MAVITEVVPNTPLARAIAVAATEDGGCANCLGHGMCAVRVQVGEGGRVEMEGECASGCTTGVGLVAVGEVVARAQSARPEEWLM